MPRPDTFKHSKSFLKMPISKPKNPSEKVFSKQQWLLLLLAGASAVSFATWQALLNNFVIERAAFTGKEIGMLQSLREIPGFMAFLVVFLLLIIRQQNLAVLALALLGLGTSLTGFLPTVFGLYFTTVIMSIGFHYLETTHESLGLQWLKKDEAAPFMGKIISVRSLATLATFGIIFLLMKLLKVDYQWIYLGGGGVTAALAIYAYSVFPQFKEEVIQQKKLILKKRYWLYYTLTFFSGARRQIFVVFAGFLMVEKFQLSVNTMIILFLVNAALNFWVAPVIGKMIRKWGERKSLLFEYTGLILVFTSYAFVEDPRIGMLLYVVDHLFFSMAIAMKTYFQKIASPEDIASTAGVSFTINHISAVLLPALLGLIWIQSPTAVFLTGTGLAAISLIFSGMVPSRPSPGEETVFIKTPMLKEV